MRQLKFIPVLFLLMVPGCSAFRGGGEEGKSPGREIQALLDRRATALNEGNIEDFLGPLSTQARDADRALAEGSQKVPVTDFAYSVETSEGLSGVEVSLSYRYRQLPPDNVFRIPLVYSFERKGPALTLTESLSDPLRLPPWATGPVEVANSEHFLALSRQAVPESAGILATAEKALGELRQTLPVEPDSTFLILLAKDRAEYESFLPAGGVQAGPRVAQANTTFNATPRNIAIEGRHIVVNLEALEQEQTGLQTFKHELAHLALAKLTTPITPGWASESAAMYLAGQKTNWTQRVARGNFEDVSFAELSRTRRLGDQDPTGQLAAVQYSYAAAAAGYLVETFGLEKYWAFYGSYAAVPASVVYRSLPANGAAEGSELANLIFTTTSDQLQAVYGLTFAQLDTGVQEWANLNP